MPIHTHEQIPQTKILHHPNLLMCEPSCHKSVFGGIEFRIRLRKNLPLPRLTIKINSDDTSKTFVKIRLEGYGSEHSIECLMVEYLFGYFNSVPSQPWDIKGRIMKSKD